MKTRTESSAQAQQKSMSIAAIAFVVVSLLSIIAINIIIHGIPNI